MNSVAKTYQDGSYAQKNPTFGDNNAEWKILNATRAIEDFKLPHRTIAEVGCGGGAILLGVAKAMKADSATGFEPMPEAYALAKSRETAQVNFLNETIGPETTGNFDLVLCFDVFEHIENYFGFLRDLSHMGSNFLFHIPLDMNAQMVARSEPIRRVREQVGHIHYFSKDSAIASLSDCGYAVRGHFYTFGGDGTYYSPLHAIMKLPRKLAFAACPHLAVQILGGYSLMAWARIEK